jgi:hypothetical protein
MHLRNGFFLPVAPDQPCYKYEYKYGNKYDPAGGKHAANIRLKVQLLFAGFKKNDKLHGLKFRIAELVYV